MVFLFKETVWRIINYYPSLNTQEISNLVFNLTPPYFLNDIYAASPFLRINFKEQNCCLTSFGSF